jgi:hypothetical protein
MIQYVPSIARVSMFVRVVGGLSGLKCRVRTINTDMTTIRHIKTQLFQNLIERINIKELIHTSNSHL